MLLFATPGAARNAPRHPGQGNLDGLQYRTSYEYLWYIYFISLWYSSLTCNAISYEYSYDFWPTVLVLLYCRGWHRYPYRYSYGVSTAGYCTVPYRTVGFPGASCRLAGGAPLGAAAASLTEGPAWASQLLPPYYYSPPGVVRADSGQWSRSRRRKRRPRQPSP